MMPWDMLSLSPPIGGSRKSTSTTTRVSRVSTMMASSTRTVKTRTPIILTVRASSIASVQSSAMTVVGVWSSGVEAGQ